MEIIVLCPLSEEILVAVRTMDLRVADRAVLCANARLSVRPGRNVRVEFDVHDIRVALKAKLPYRTPFEHLRVIRAVRCMARSATFGLERGMFERERALHLRVATEAGLVRSQRDSGLLALKSAVRVVAIAAVHRSFKHFMAEGFRELCLHFRVATYTKLRLISN